MLRKFLLAKIHRATVTQCDPHYVGSITIDALLLEESGIRPNEAVHVLDVDNGARFETYVIKGPAGSGIIGVNGAAALLTQAGHRVIILAYGLGTGAELHDHQATVVLVDAGNRRTETLRYPSRLDAEPTAKTVSESC